MTKTINCPQKIQAGFTFVELVIVMGLALVFLLGTSSLFYLAIRSSSKASFASQARALAQEGIEAVIAIRDIGGADWDWSNTPLITAAGEYYQPFLSTSTWKLGNKLNASPAAKLSPPDDAFTRTVKIESVQRAVGCGLPICSIVTAGGTVDVNTKKITVIVSWSEDDGAHNLTIENYLIRWR
ncbi:type II secretion system protein [Candidatus Curtissbacteria bacterium]|nr:type II secretion system protein [Candidatus Curtissbacteria bacterium]